MNALIRRFGLAIISIVLFSCSSKEPAQFRIGFSQCTGADAWRRQMLLSMQRELTFQNGLDLIYRDAAGNNEKQIKDIKELLGAGIDLLIVSPNESDPITPVVEEVFESGTPVIVVDRRTSSTRYTAYIGADNYEIGRLAGKYIADLLDGRGNIIEIWGLRGSSPAVDRHKGFIEVIKEYPGLSVVREIDGEWELDTARRRLKQEILSIEPFDLVFAHNDIMAYGAYTVCKSRLPSIDNIKFIGIDGLPGPSAGIQFVNDEILDATFLYSTGGEEAIRIASRILTRKPFEKENILSSTTIDASNVGVMKLQTDKLLSQQEDIVRQQEKIKEQIRTFYNQRVGIYVLLVSLTVMMIAGSAAFLAWREVKVMNARLNAKNKEIVAQRDRIAEMAKNGEVATEQKLKFFTDVSHQFQTPLTLILDPVEELLQGNGKNEASAEENLKLVKKNALRLSRLVNQLMDFVKIDSRRMVIQASPNDIIQFIREIMADFEKTAKKRKIDFRLVTRLEKLEVWFDRDKIDKVIFNLLSNAFKYTPDEGRIYVKVSSLESRTHAIISFEDNGRGMSAAHVAHAFNRFFSGRDFVGTGTGLGLALSKEYIELHHGNIRVSSELSKGTQFVIALPLGNAHFEDSEIAPSKVQFNKDADYSALLDESVEMSLEQNNAPREHTILIIDNHKEFREHLRHRLESLYFIAEASDGGSGVKKAFDIVPDLIICDAILPGKEGYEVTRMLKDDLRTSHIPIIMLTATGSLDERITGLKYGVDAYVTKPYKFEYLNERIKALIRSRQILKEHYSHNLGGEINHSAHGALDKHFINRFTFIVKKNLSNSEFSVNDIAREVGMSKVQVYRKVKALLGYSVNEYIINIRLRTARFLLLHSEKTIAEIADEVGFSSPAYFSTSFKSKFNLTPTELRSYQVSL